MMRRVLSVFDRYAERNLRLERPLPPAVSTDPAAPFAVTRHAVEAGRIVIEGRAPQGPVTLRRGTQTRTGLSRPGVSGTPRFTLSLPFGPGDIEVVAGADVVVLHAVPVWRLRLARAAMVPRFGVTLAGSVPLVWRWLGRRDALARRLVRDRLGLGPVEVAGDIDAAVLRRAPEVGLEIGPEIGPDVVPATPPHPVRIIMPVYNGLDMLRETLDRVVRHTDMPAHLLIIDDASPDPGIAPFLRDFAARHDWVEVLGNVQNLGFIGSVNRGFAAARAAAPDAPVILLNSDAYVPAGWATRLVAPLNGADVASVTPMSNDAELMNVPVICASIGLPAGAGDMLDAAARRLSARPVDLPTGVGFCMAFSPKFLAQVPLFDTAFGRGYGEEVDWCQRTAALGGRHLGLPTLFVEHRGGGSFGSETKARLMAENGARIAARWPGFDGAVRAVLAADPLLTVRLVLGLRLAAFAAAARLKSGPESGPESGPDSGPIAVFVAHTMGGGADIDLARRVAVEVARCGAAVVLRLGTERRWQIELSCAAGRTGARTDDRAVMLELLGLLGRRRMIYSCAVGDENPAELPALILELAGDVPPEVLIHDFFTLSPSMTLQDADGIYRGLPRAHARAQDDNPAHRMRTLDGARAGLAGWRAAWAPLMQRAGRIEAFCASAAALVAEAYPQAAAAIVVRPHAPLWQPDAATAARLRAKVEARVGQKQARRSPPVIGIMGLIGQAKGAALLAPLAAALARRGWPRLVLLGDIDPAYALPRAAVAMHGRYEVAEIPALIERHGITDWLIPSVCPETFSFTTQEALATGLPVWCFDLGGQADQVAAATATGAPGGLIPLTEGRCDFEAWLDRVA